METISMKRPGLATIAILASALMMSACANTIRGVGRDAANTVNATQSAGKSVAKAVQ
jgi:entericidin B